VIALAVPAGVVVACAAEAVSLPAAFLSAFLLVTVLGFLDDLRSLPAMLRLVAYAGVSAGFVLAQGGFTSLWTPWGTLGLSLYGAVLAFLWLFGLVNAYNFMDGIDGIAGIQAVVAATAWLLIGLMSSDVVIIALGASIAGGSAGFLIHNWSPARVFMGDVGSATLGFSFAALPLLNDGVPARDAPIVGVLVVWPFVADSAFTFTRRLLAGANVLTPHRTHLYQRLVIAGWSHRAVAVLYGGLAVAGACPGLLLAAGLDWIRPAAIVIPVVFFIGLCVGVRAVERRAARPPSVGR
jgi:UDP-N-acetylmuramyl pentapeptide phosphotransferase/UDP-N-acetylglucosamine-1-phosphate transferase